MHPNPVVLAVLVAAIGLGTVPVAGAAEPPPAVAAAATNVPSDFALRALGGGNYRLSEYRGEVVALVFWATWCGNCRAALDSAERLQATYGASGLRVLGINLDDNADAARQLATAAGVTFPVLQDADKSISRGFRVDRLPLTVLIDRSGAVRSLNGTVDARAERRLVEDIRALLNE